MSLNLSMIYQSKDQSKDQLVNTQSNRPSNLTIELAIDEPISNHISQIDESFAKLGINEIQQIANGQIAPQKKTYDTTMSEYDDFVPIKHINEQNDLLQKAYDKLIEYINITDRTILNLENGYFMTEDLDSSPDSIGSDDGMSKNEREKIQYMDVIVKEISSTNESEEIKKKAIEIFRQMKLTIANIKGKPNWTKCKFACIYYAHEELNQPIDPKNLAVNIGTNPKNIKEALSAFSEVETGYCPVKRQTSPTELVPSLLKTLGIINGYEDAQRFCDKILEKNDILVHNYFYDDLRDLFPQNVAAAVLLYYLEIHGNIINVQTYPTIVARKKATIGSIYRKVIQYDGKISDSSLASSATNAN
jgi:hypothetical protein